MLVCNVSMPSRRGAIAADVAEAASALDNLGLNSGQVVFVTLVDDPASVAERIDAYLGEIMIEAASAADVADGSVVAAGAVFASFAPSTLVQATLSNGNFTITQSTTNQGAGGNSLSFVTSGKVYFEFTVTASLASGSHIIGAITSAASSFGAAMNGGVNCIMLTVSTGGSTLYSNGSATAVGVGPVAVGDVIGFALDLGARKGWVRKNNGNWDNNATHNPATGANGSTLYATVGYAPSMYFGASSGVGSRFDLNSGQSAFANAAPAGFTGFPG